MKVKNWQLGLALGIGVTTVALAMNSCATIPKGAVAVKPFDREKYLGKWYDYLKQAQSLGYDVQSLVWTKHNKQ